MQKLWSIFTRKPTSQQVFGLNLRSILSQNLLTVLILFKDGCLPSEYYFFKKKTFLRYGVIYEIFYKVHSINNPTYKPFRAYNSLQSGTRAEKDYE